MTKLGASPSRKVLKALAVNGVSHQRPAKGSHVLATDPENPRRRTNVPHGEVRVGTLRRIVAQIGDDREHFAEKLSRM